MSNASGSSRESNSSRRICHLRVLTLGHIIGKLAAVFDDIDMG